MRGLHGFEPYQILEKELQFTREHLQNAGQPIKSGERGRSWVCFYPKGDQMDELLQLNDILYQLYNEPRHLRMGTGYHRYTKEAYDCFQQIKINHPHLNLTLDKTSPNHLIYLLHAVDPTNPLFNKSKKNYTGFVREISTRGINSPHDKPAILIKCEVPNSHLHQLWSVIANTLNLDFVGLYAVPACNMYFNTDINQEFFDTNFLVRGMWTDLFGFNLPDIKSVIDYLEFVHQCKSIGNPREALFGMSEQVCGNLIRCRDVTRLMTEVTIIGKLKECYRKEKLKIIRYNFISNDQIK